MKRILLTLLKLLIAAYILLCGLLYFFQEKIIFHPSKLDKNFKFQFDQNFEEINFKTNDHLTLNGILFKAANSKGLIFYLHGNAGSVNNWGQIAKTYTDLGYDVLMTDYRGYGKSEGKINGEGQVFEDLQVVYNKIKERYQEDKIIIMAYSIGTGPGAKLAAENKPKLLVLQAPYYSLVDMMKHSYPFAPTFLLKYKFETYKFVQACKMPVIIFHGNQDEVIYYNASVKLRAVCKPADTLITLNGQGHNGITVNPDYITSIQKILSH